MAMKEKISLARDRMVEKINSSGAAEFEKTELTNILIDAAEGTNGLSKEDKLQRVSETVFALAMLDAQGALDRLEAAERDKELKESIGTLTQKIDNIDTRLTANDEKTNEILDVYKKMSEKENAKNSKITRVFDGLDKIFKGGKWYWALTVLIVLVSFIYKTDIVELIKHVF